MWIPDLQHNCRKDAGEITRCAKKVSLLRKILPELPGHGKHDGCNSFWGPLVTRTEHWSLRFQKKTSVFGLHSITRSMRARAMKGSRGEGVSVRKLGYHLQMSLELTPNSQLLTFC